MTQCGLPEEAILDQLSRQRKEDSCQEKERREGKEKDRNGVGKTGESRSEEERM